MAVYFLGAEAATASLLLQRATGHFDVRTCKAAMPQMRVSAALVVKTLGASPNRLDSRFSAPGDWSREGMPASMRSHLCENEIG